MKLLLAFFKAKTASLTRPSRVSGTGRLAPVLLLLLALAPAALSGAPLAATNSAPTPLATYHNPLLPERELADPQVLRFEGNYYLYATSDTRGYEVFVSSNLVNWAAKGQVFKDPRGGDWAPEVFHNRRGDGKFYLYYTDTAPRGLEKLQHKQIGVAVADSPMGPFVDKGALACPAIDAHPFQDEDGRLYLYYVELEAGFKIMGQPMANPLTKQGEAKELLHPSEAWETISGQVTEGPFMWKHKGLYYLTFSGTGADSPNYGIGYATATSPMGPFTKFAGNPIVHRGGSVLGPGHHCIVEGPDAKLWLVYHQKWEEQKNYHRFLALDPLWFDEQGVLHGSASRGTEQPVPALLGPTAKLQR